MSLSIFIFLDNLEGQNIQRFSSGNCCPPMLSVLSERRRDDRRIQSTSPKSCPYVIIVNNYIVIVSYCSAAIITTNVESWHLETAEFGYIECSVEVLTRRRGKKVIESQRKSHPRES